MEWINNPCFDRSQIAGELYGTRSRLHTRWLEHKLQGRIAFEAWEREHLEKLKKQIIQRIVQP